MRKRNVTGYRIEVEARDLGDFGCVSVGTDMLYGITEEGRQRLLRDQKERAEEIARQIKRHVDNVHSAHAVEETEMVCEYCGHRWTEVSDTYNGGCCDRDEANNPNADASHV